MLLALHKDYANLCRKISEEKKCVVPIDPFWMDCCDLLKTNEAGVTRGKALFIYNFSDREKAVIVEHLQEWQHFYHIKLVFAHSSAQLGKGNTQFPFSNEVATHGIYNYIKRMLFS